jgi:hypothetical protein
MSHETIEPEFWNGIYKSFGAGPNLFYMVQIAKISSPKLFELDKLFWSVFKSVWFHINFGQASFYLLEPAVNTELCRLCYKSVWTNRKTGHKDEEFSTKILDLHNDQTNFLIRVK